MSGSDKDKGKWGTTRQIEVVKEAVASALANADETRIMRREDPPADDPVLPPPDITQAKLPVKVVIGLVLYAVGQVLTLAGVYYDLRADVRSLQEATDSPEITEVRLRVEQMDRDLQRIESQNRESPTAMDNMRRVGELNADVRELKARVRSLERQ
jgi:hypothetical protein